MTAHGNEKGMDVLDSSHSRMLFEVMGRPRGYLDIFAT